MTIASPLWLLLLALPIILLLLSIDRGARSVVVSSELLWRHLPSVEVRTWRPGKPSVSLSLLASLLALAALALAASGPWRVRAQPPAAIAVIVDCSAGMEDRLQPEGPRRIDVARDAARKVLRDGAASVFRLLILAGDEPRVAVAWAGDDEPLERELSRISPSRGAGAVRDLSAAAAKVVHARGGGRVVVVSDLSGSAVPTPSSGADDVVFEAIDVGAAATRPPAASAGTQRDLTTAGCPLRIASEAVASTEIRAAVLALEGQRAASAGSCEPVTLFVGALPRELPPRWIYFPASAERTHSEPRPPIALDLVDRGNDLLGAFDLVTVESRALPPTSPPVDAVPIALAAGIPAVAVVESPTSRGVFWGVPVDATSVSGQGLLPVLLSSMVAWLEENPRRTLMARVVADEGRGSANPRPPPARDGWPVVVDRVRPTPLRAAILWAALALVVMEMARRGLAILRDRARLRTAIVRDLGLLTLVAFLVIASLARPRWMLSRPRTLAVLVDVSGSVPSQVRAGTVTEIRKLLGTLAWRTQVAVFAFDGEARLQGIGTRAQASEWLDSVARLPPSDSPTDLGRAILDAARLVVANGGGSILVSTDGRDVVGDAEAALDEAAREGVRVDVLPLPASREPEISVEGLTTPVEVRPDEIFEAVAVVRSTVAQHVKVVLQQDGEEVASQEASLEAGAAHAIRFVARAGRSRASMVALVFPERDQDPSNNLARSDLEVSGSTRFAIVGFGSLANGSAEHWDRLPRWDRLDRYDAVALRLSADFLPSVAEQEGLARFVRGGHGLVVVLADPEVAASLRGGPLEDVLPVRLEPPRPNGDQAAVVLLLDRSGSMAPSDTPGPSSLSIALQGTREFVSLLDEEDRFGLIAFDVAPHVLRPLAAVRSSPEDFATSIPDLKAGGGTDWTSSIELALAWLTDDPATRRHLVLISDGHLAPGAMPDRIAKWPTGVTLSTVTVGAGADQEAMARLAAQHGGRHEHSERIQDLPTALLRDGADLRPPRSRRGPLLTQPEPTFAPIVPAARIRPGAEVLVVTPREDAEVALRTEQGDPLLAFRRAEWGTSAFVATGPDSLDRRGAFEQVVSIALMRTASEMDSHRLPALSVAVRRGRAEVDLLLGRASSAAPTASVRFPSGRQMSLEMRPKQPGRAGASLVCSEAGEYLVEADGSRARFVVEGTPERVCLPDDPSWAERLARRGTGLVVSNIANARLRPERREWSQEIASALIGVAAALLFVDSVRRGRRLGELVNVPAHP